MNANAPPRVVVITGLSGSGKTLALRCFEDMSYYCVDNLPVALIPTFHDLCSSSGKEIEKVAICVDIREGTFLQDFPRVYDDLRARNPRVELLFFESDDAMLLRRFSETRRPHPLASGGSLPEGIRRERSVLLPVKERADLVIDTSRMTVHELRETLVQQFSDQTGLGRLNITIVSFGYKYGLPEASDLVFDVRFLPNPHFVDGLREKTGLDPEVEGYLASSERFVEFQNRLLPFLRFLIPAFAQEGKSYLTISFGCTGGKHRSVLVSRLVLEALHADGFRAEIRHRDLGRE